jgi:hypothetical protein
MIGMVIHSAMRPIRIHLRRSPGLSDGHAAQDTPSTGRGPRESGSTSLKGDEVVAGAVRWARSDHLPMMMEVMMHSGRIEVSSQSGGIEINRRIRSQWQGMSDFLRGRSISLPDGIDVLGVVLRGSGAITDFGFSGLGPVRLIKNQTIIGMDIGLPEDIWIKSDLEVAKFICDSIVSGLPRASSLLNKRGFIHDRTMFEHEVKSLCDEYVEKLSV